MAKNKDILTGLSKLLTEKTLENIVKQATGGKNIEIVDWKSEGASKKGDSYLSTVTRLTIEAIVDNKKNNLKVVIKSLPDNLGRRKTFRSAEFFRNEITFYTKVLRFYIFYYDTEIEMTIKLAGI